MQNDLDDPNNGKTTVWKFAMAISDALVALDVW